MEKDKKIFSDSEIAEGFKEWQGMPEFSLDDLTPFHTIMIHFANKQDMEKFAELIQQSITMKTKSRWFPKNSHKSRSAASRYINESEK